MTRLSSIGNYFSDDQPSCKRESQRERERESPMPLVFPIHHRTIRQPSIIPLMVRTTTADPASQSAPKWRLERKKPYDRNCSRFLEKRKGARGENSRSKCKQAHDRTLNWPCVFLLTHLHSKKQQKLSLLFSQYGIIGSLQSKVKGERVLDV